MIGFILNIPYSLVRLIVATSNDLAIQNSPPRGMPRGGELFKSNFGVRRCSIYSGNGHICCIRTVPTLDPLWPAIDPPGAPTKSIR